MKILSIIQKENSRKVTFIDAAVVRTKTFPGDWDDAKIFAALNDKTPAAESMDYTIKPVDIDGLRNPGIAVCVTCHEAYLQYLPKQIEAIEAQTVKPAEKILVLDGCDKPYFVPADWVIIRTDAKSPNPGRNLAIQQTTASWMVFADADDAMHPDFIAAYAEKIKGCAVNIGLFYPDLHCSNGRKMINPEYDFWQLRLHDHISMASCWRVAALKDIGGLCNFKRYDDWSMALKITRLGWVLEKQDKVPVLYNIHGGEHRSLTPDSGLECLWQAHTFGIVTLLAGRENCLPDWKHWLLNAELPPDTTVYVLDNSGKESFGQDVRAFLAGQTRFKFMYIKYSKPAQLGNDWLTRHRFVPSLYNKILPYVNDDWLVFLEDDTVPPLNGLLKIMEAWEFRGKKYGGISGCYPSRQRPNEYVGTMNTSEQNWGRMYSIASIKEDRLYPAGCIAGGFAVYQNALIKRSMPFQYYLKKGKPSGWDTNLSVFIRQQGYKLFLHGGVKCQHNFEDTQLQGAK